LRTLSHAKELAASIIANQTVKEEVQQEKEEIKKNQIEQVYNLSYAITDDIFEVYKKTDYLPWQSFDLTNVGPNPVYFSVNKWLSPEAPLPVGQSINIDFKAKGGIRKVFLKCDRGETAKVLFYVVK